jgi:hypothetical protein
MKLSALLKTLAKNAGIESQKDLSEFIEANKDSLELDFPDVAANLISENLLSMDVAKNSLDLKNYFLGKSLPGIEQSAMEEAIEQGLTPEKIAEIHKETPSTGKRITLYLKALNDVHKSNGKAKPNDEILKQIQELQLKAADIEKVKNEEINGLKSKFNSQLEDYTWQSEVAKIKWNKYIPEDLRPMALKNAIEKEVAKHNGKLIFDPETRQYNIVNSADPAVGVSANGKVLDYATIFPLALQEHKLLDVETPGGAGSDNPGTNPFSGNPKPEGTKLTSFEQKAINGLNSVMEEISNS